MPPRLASAPLEVTGPGHRRLRVLRHRQHPRPDHGHIARQQIRDSEGAEGGEGLATAGIATRAVSLVLVVGVLGIVFLITLLGRSASEKFSAVGSVIQ